MMIVTGDNDANSEYNELRSSVSGAWASIPKVVGLIPTVVRHIFQLAWCGYKLRVTPQTSFSSEYITPRYVKILILYGHC